MTHHTTPHHSPKNATFSASAEVRRISRAIDSDRENLYNMMADCNRLGEGSHWQDASLKAREETIRALEIEIEALCRRRRMLRVLAAHEDYRIAEARYHSTHVASA